MLDGRQSAIWTLLPGIVQSFDATTMRCSVQVAISFTQIQSDGVGKTVTIDGGLIDCPVLFPSGGGWLFTFPIAEGDECEVRFSSRCIDAWWQSGGVQPQQEFRMHDLSDGFVSVGVFSQPNVPENVATNAAEIRNTDRSVVGRFAVDKITLKHPTQVLVDAPELHCTGTITDGTNVSVGAHHHTGVTTGGGITGGPVG